MGKAVGEALWMEKCCTFYTPSPPTHHPYEHVGLAHPGIKGFNPVLLPWGPPCDLNLVYGPTDIAPPFKVSQVFHCPSRPSPCPWVPHGWPSLHHLTSKIKFQLLIYLRPQVQRKKYEHQFELTFLSHPTLQGVELTGACCFSKKFVNGLDVSLFNIRFC